jgi:BirA family transcriptional regulator, biotin operon repressor / biotin---[acetyl-CoA-carboxylase] ligase
LGDGTFDRAAFGRALRTGRLGHVLFTRGVVESTNDVAWELAQQGADEGACVVADVQTRGRGRQGRLWHTAPGKGLALSVLLHPGCDPAGAAGPTRYGTASLVAGVAMAHALDALGVDARLKWPNDLLVSGRKLSGILVEGRRGADGTDLVVMGLGVNVSQTEEDFPAELRAAATSLSLEGRHVTRETMAAAFLTALEPLWDEHQEGDARQALAAWRERASFWGRPVSVTTPSGTVEGTARDLDERGGLVIQPAAGPPATTPRDPRRRP